MADDDGRIDLGIDGLGPAEHIGRGGFADVYRAEQLSLRRTVAVKVLRAHASKPEQEARFRRECHAIGAVSDHPHIVGVHEGGFTRNGRAYLVMEYLPGGSLADRLAREGTLPVPEVVDTAVKIARALAVAHRAGVLHRDVKPPNIMISAYGEPALGDFGIARIEGGHQTTTGMVTASISHAAPEVLEGHAPTAAADVYSLGSTMFELLTGRAPYYNPADESVWPLMKRILSEPMPSGESVGMSSALGRVFLRATARQPADRYEDADQLADDLAALLDDPVALAYTPPEPAELEPVDADATAVVSGPVIGVAAGSPLPASKPDLTMLRSSESAIVTPEPLASTATMPSATGGPQSAEAAFGPARRSPLGPVVLFLTLVAVVGAVAAAVWGLLLPAIDERGSGEDRVAAGAPVASVEGATTGPLRAGMAYTIEVPSSRQGASYRLLVDGTPVGDASSTVPDLTPPPGRHQLVVEITTGGEVLLSAPVDFYAIGDPPTGGFGAHLARIPAVADRWPSVIEAYDVLGAAGHTQLEVLHSDDLLGVTAGEWLLSVPGFGDDGGAAEAYCAEFELPVPERCYAGLVVPADTGP